MRGRTTEDGWGMDEVGRCDLTETTWQPARDARVHPVEAGQPVVCWPYTEHLRRRASQGRGAGGGQRTEPSRSTRPTKLETIVPPRAYVPDLPPPSQPHGNESSSVQSSREAGPRREGTHPVEGRGGARPAMGWPGRYMRELLLELELAAAAAADMRLIEAR